MPIPKPNKEEKRADFMQRCVKSISGEYKTDQAYAICNLQWEQYKQITFIKLIKKYGT